MIARNPPMVFRFAAMLLLSSAALDQWWQRQPLGADGHALVTMMHSYCPGVGGGAGPLTVADSARLLDRWGYALLGDLTGWNGRDRCTLPLPRQGEGIDKTGRRSPGSAMKGKRA